jgi:hypothetical protein
MFMSIRYPLLFGSSALAIFASVGVVAQEASPRAPAATTDLPAEASALAPAAYISPVFYVGPSQHPFPAVHPERSSISGSSRHGCPESKGPESVARKASAGRQHDKTATFCVPAH